MFQFRFFLPTIYYAPRHPYWGNSPYRLSKDVALLPEGRLGMGNNGVRNCAGLGKLFVLKDLHKFLFLSADDADDADGRR